MTLINYAEFENHMRLIKSLVAKEKLGSLQNLLKDMTEVYIKERYPIRHSLFELSQVDGIPDGAEVLERKEVKLLEFVYLSKRKGINYEDIPLFTSLTLKHPDWERVESVYPLGDEITLSTLVKWEYPSKIKEYAQYLHSLPNVINTYTDA